MKPLQSFTFGEDVLRVIADQEGEPMFCFRDACNALEIADRSRARRRFNRDGVIQRIIPTQWGPSNMAFVSEQNLMRMVLFSRSDCAVKFARWIVDKVVPKFCETGTESPEDALEHERRKRAEAEKQIAELREELEMRDHEKDLQEGNLIRLIQTVIRTADAEKAPAIPEDTEAVFQRGRRAGYEEAMTKINTFINGVGK